MSNTINAITKYVPLLDEKYKWEAKSSILDAPETMVRMTDNAKTIKIAKRTLEGLADYNKAGGFVSRDITLEWQEHTLAYDRGAKFQVDAMDDEETAGLSFGNLAGDYIRLHVAPELDAYRFAKYYDAAENKVTGTITNENVVQAFDTAMLTMDDAEVPEEGRILFVSPAVFAAMKTNNTMSRKLDLKDMGQSINRNIYDIDGVTVIKVPQGRFQTGITLQDGTTSGQEEGGFESDGEDINFLLIHPTSVFQIGKHTAPRIFNPATNQDADAWRYDYRIYGDAFALEEKTSGIYGHAKEA